MQLLKVPGLSPKTPETATSTTATPVSIRSGGSILRPAPLSPMTSPKLFFFEPGMGTILMTEDAVNDLNNVKDWNADLPKGWELCRDTKGRTFYFNASRGTSTWHHPREALHEELRQLIAKARREHPGEVRDSVERRANAARSFMQELNERAQRDLSNWRGPFLSKEGRFPYWFSNELQCSSWNDPAIDWDEQLQFSRRTLCCELGLEEAHLAARPKGSSLSFRMAAKGVIAAHSFRQMTLNHRRSYSKDKAVSLRTIEQIDLDIPRTACGDAELESCLGIARALLLRQAAEDPELGYCQGMNMVAVLFAVASQTQAEAFFRFHAFIQSLRGLWEEGFPLLQQGICTFETLATDRPWFQHLKRNGVEPEMYLPGAWLGLFSCWLPLATRVLLLRSLEEGHLESMLALSLAILDHIGSLLLEQGDDMDDLLELLHSIKEKPPHPAALLTARDAWFPKVSATKARRSSFWKMRFRREGSDVLDHQGQAVFAKRPSLAGAGRALLKFCFKDLGRHCSFRNPAAGH